VNPLESLQRLAKDHRVFFDPRFQAQTNFLIDRSPLVAGFCTRRSGKTYGAALKLVNDAYNNPAVSCLYIALSRDSAKRIMWRDCLKVINKKYNLNCIFNETMLTMTFPNESQVALMGMDADENEKAKALGQKYKCCVIDEAASFTTNLKELCYGVLKPALSDYRGQLLMIGTPSNFVKGLFYEVTQGTEPGWSLHKWTAFDNPFQVGAWREELAEIERDRPLFKETPLFKQHYLGMWVIETDKLVYKFNPDRNLFKTRPTIPSQAEWAYVLGVDLGHDDDSAFVLCAFHENHKILYIVSTFNKKGMDLTDVANKIREFMASYPVGKIIVDGADKQGVEEIRRRHGLPLEASDKHDKVTFIELLNSELIQGNVKIHENCQNLYNEMSGLVWKTTSDVIDIPRKEHPSLPNHLCDAMLYAWRYCYQYAWEPIVKRPVIGTKAWHDEQNDKIWEIEREKIEEEYKKANGDDW
jgi:PBSX family phage terminase large subunit